jgi:pimeloyl-ACP methyl ester carboxylesterase
VHCHRNSKAVSQAATSNGIAADLIILPHINNVTAASISTPGVGPDSDPNTQYNLVGYSYGSALAAQQALTDAGNGNVVSNLVLIGAPLNQDLMNAVKSNTNIRNVITINIPGDPIRAGMSDGAIAMASPQLALQMARGIGHFTYAGSSAAAAERRRILARDLYGRGVR